MPKANNITRREAKHFTPLHLLGPISRDKATGKTIDRIVHNGGGFFIVFTDGSFMDFFAECDECGNHVPIGAATDIYHALPQQLLEAGVISQEQFDAWREEEQRNRNAKHAQWERKEYERLKAKFEQPEPVPPQPRPEPLFDGVIA